MVRIIRRYSGIEKVLDRHNKLLATIATQAAELEALRGEVATADHSRTCYARALEKMRIALVSINDGLEDEGDRIYLASTNHADDIKAAWQMADALNWEQILEHTQPKTDLAATNLRLQAENATLAAGACDQGDRGMVGDDHGHFYCAMAVENTQLRARVAALEEGLRVAYGALAALPYGNTRTREAAKRIEPLLNHNGEAG